jgi:hypothetical protein
MVPLWIPPPSTCPEQCMVSGQYCVVVVIAVALAVAR